MACQNGHFTVVIVKWSFWWTIAARKMFFSLNIETYGYWTFFNVLLPPWNLALHFGDCVENINSHHADSPVTCMFLHVILGPWHQKHVSQTWISNCIPQYSVGCNYLSLPGNLQTNSSVTCIFLHSVWGLWCQEQVSQAGISNCIPQHTVGCNYLSLSQIPASGTKVLIYSYIIRADSRYAARLRDGVNL